MTGTSQNLGKFVYCLGVDNLENHINKYTKQGFQPTGGNKEKSYLILTDGNMELGLFDQYFSGPLMNFRGGNIRKLHKQFSTIPQPQDHDTSIKEGKDGSISFTLIDPAGTPVLFDTHPSEEDLLSSENYQTLVSAPTKYRIEIYTPLPQEMEQFYLDIGLIEKEGRLCSNNLVLYIKEAENNRIELVSQ